ncbi:acyl-CoA thioesterase [Desertibacillus haloalkaliphilus]|uniref:acyl-CoA thioesterase n=1 Tax=Desertibacillus haloalkaliphilus TaxID=1328930 RepID=UPI001C273E2C|nr:acyl-CoA thioesterase [Desertibacillus haloalkaliphilus]MBU8906848.1 acyl-CoA thioesterase [Desertibacillus haloalkaliphilus]
MKESKAMKESRAIKVSIVLPPDTNNHRTLFGGKLMSYIDDVAAIAATRHARKDVVTASTDSIDFLNPIKEGHAVCLEAFVTWTHKTSMEVFVKAIGEDLLTGERSVCAVSFLTFVAVDENMRPVQVSKVIPETPEEKKLHEGAEARAEVRRKRRGETVELANEFGVIKPWD